MVEEEGSVNYAKGRGRSQERITAYEYTSFHSQLDQLRKPPKNVLQPAVPRGWASGMWSEGTSLMHRENPQELVDSGAFVCHLGEESQ